MSAYSYHSHTALGLDLSQYDGHEDYSSIYPGAEPEIDPYYKSHLGMPFPLDYHADHHADHPLLGPMDSPQTVAPRALEGSAYHFDHTINSIDPGDSLLRLPPQPSPLLASSPISDASDYHTFSVPSSVSTNQSAPLPREDEYVPSEPESDDGSEYTPCSSKSAPRGGQGSRQPRSINPVPKPARKTPYSTSKKARQSPPSRVYQSSGSTANLMQAALVDHTTAMGLKWVCPEEACEYKMGLKARLPDFRRHLRAHLRDQNRAAGTGHICKGLLLADFNQLSDLQQDAILQGSDGAFPLNGEERIGGCQQSFSRGDALTRHVKSKANPCVGWVSGHLEPRHLLNLF